VVTVGVLARFKVKPGLEQDVADFFKEGLPLVEAQPSTTVWFAFRLNETTYGAFSAFASVQDRDALLASGGPQLSRKYAHLFAEPPSFDEVDVLEARL
jgi:quinol monooxygenase YgiN